MKTHIIDTTIPQLGKPKILSPIQDESTKFNRNFVTDQDRILINVDVKTLKQAIKSGEEISSFEQAGPRSKIYFDPSKLRCGLVTCGGLCPGLNDIIRSIVLELYYGYGVRNICGIRYGLQGLIPKYGHEIIELRPALVATILNLGGSILGSSRGPQPIDEIVDSLERMNIGILFMIGGDGTLVAEKKLRGSSPKEA